MKKLVSVILLLCAIGLFTMSMIDIVNAIDHSEEFKPVEIYEFTNKSIDWS